MRLRRGSVVLMAMVVLVGACSWGDDDGDDGGAAPSASSSTEAVDLSPPDAELPTSFDPPSGPGCESPSGSLLVTADCVDPELATAPFVDVDEERETTDPDTDVTVTYRYIHGGFTDTDARFSFYFPSEEAYEGRFFESTYPTVSEEEASPGTVAFAISNGAYVVSTNNSGGVSASPSLGGYRTNAAAAKFSRVIAAELYGEDAPTRGYLYGASGGAYQTLAGAERTEGVWDGFVPMVPGVPNSIPSFMSVQVLALRVLADDWPAIVDAMEPGGSGDPYATLDAEERAVLEEATRLGHPLRGWWQHETLRGGAFALVTPAVTGVDATYAEDFFTQPGYEGREPEVQAARVELDTTVESVDDGKVVLADEPEGFVLFSDLVVTGGSAAGSTVPTVTVEGDTVTLAPGTDPGLAAGDTVRIDNSFYLALSYYHRHQVPSPDQYGWDQFRADDGTPIPPQRPILVGEVLSDVFGGVATGDFNGHMIMLSSLLDVQAFPWAADWYLGQASEALGDDLDDRYRLWYMDNTDHQPPPNEEGYAHIVRYDSELQQALLDLDAWVLDGTPPPISTSYEVTDDNQVEVAPTAAQRGGVQPVPELTVAAGDACEGGDEVRAEVSAGEPVALDLAAAVPPDTGEIVRIEWDVESTGSFDVDTDLDEPAPEVEECEVHTYDEPGTYFAVARVTSQREGDPDSPYRLIQNLARVRVVVG